MKNSQGRMPCKSQYRVGMGMLVTTLVATFLAWTLQPAPSIGRLKDAAQQSQASFASAPLEPFGPSEPCEQCLQARHRQGQPELQDHLEQKSSSDPNQLSLSRLSLQNRILTKSLTKIQTQAFTPTQSYIKTTTDLAVVSLGTIDVGDFSVQHPDNLADPGGHSLADPIADPGTSPTADPMANPVADPIADPASSSADPMVVVNPTPDPTANPAADPDFKINYDMPVRPEMKVYLTFDDGPSEYTEEILNTLNEYEAAATFFMLEPHIRSYASLVQRMAEEGHALGSHGVTHQHNIFYKSTESMISEMDQTITAIREITGVGSPLIRVPYGSVPNVSQNQMKILAEHGYKLWDWNVDSGDWRTKDARYVTTTIKQVQKLREQEIAPIILLHDMKTTAAHLSDLLDYLAKRGYIFCALDPSLPEYHIRSSSN